MSLCGLPGCSSTALPNEPTCQLHKGLEPYIEPPNTAGMGTGVEVSIHGDGIEYTDKYADNNPKSIHGAKKYCLRLLPLPANIEVNRALENGVTKYGAANWRQAGVAASVYVDAALRHLFQWFDGRQERAEDSGVHNLGHAMACLAIVIDAQANGMLIDDRPFPCKDTDALLRRSEV